MVLFASEVCQVHVDLRVFVVLMTEYVRNPENVFGLGKFHSGLPVTETVQVNPFQTGVLQPVRDLSSKTYQHCPVTRWIWVEDVGSCFMFNAFSIAIVLAETLRVLELEPFSGLFMLIVFFSVSMSVQRSLAIFLTLRPCLSQLVEMLRLFFQRRKSKRPVLTLEEQKVASMHNAF